MAFVFWQDKLLAAKIIKLPATGKAYSTLKRS
jgi:hypothetical protein